MNKKVIIFTGLSAAALFLIIKKSDKISKFLNLLDVIKSATAERLGIDNSPTKEHLRNIKALAKNVYDPLIEKFGKIQIASFYRGKELNAKIPGASTRSQHTFGQAMDIKSANQNFTNADIFQYIVNNLDYDQIIWEFGTNTNPQWVHVSFNIDGNRKKKTRAVKVDGKTKYINF